LKKKLYFSNKTISLFIASIGIFFIVIALELDSIGIGRKYSLNSILTKVTSKKNKEEDKKTEVILNDIGDINLAETMLYVPPRVEVYDGLTFEELVDKLNRNLKNDITNKGDVIASKCLELGVDPYVATAIILHETGCGQSSCSKIARECYNFGGQKGSGCGMYKRYYSVDEGLQGMIQNLYNNYYSKGLTTIDTIAPRYAESSAWPAKIHWYVNKIKNN